MFRAKFHVSFCDRIGNLFNSFKLLLHIDDIFSTNYNTSFPPDKAFVSASYIALLFEMSSAMIP